MFSITAARVQLQRQGQASGSCLQQLCSSRQQDPVHGVTPGFCSGHFCGPEAVFRAVTAVFTTPVPRHCHARAWAWIHVVVPGETNPSRSPGSAHGAGGGNQGISRDFGKRLRNFQPKPDLRGQILLSVPLLRKLSKCGGIGQGCSRLGSDVWLPMVRMAAGPSPPALPFIPFCHLLRNVYVGCSQGLHWIPPCPSVQTCHVSSPLEPRPHPHPRC